MAWRPQARRTERNKREHKQTTTERGYGWDWQCFRENFIAEHPLCEDCLEKGIAKPTEEVHHKVKIKHDKSKRLDPENCRGLCGDCHDARTSRGE